MSPEGQKRNMKEMVHTDARLTNDYEITKASSARLYREVPRNVPLISYNNPFRPRLKLDESSLYRKEAPLLSG